ncbi:MAG: YIP1 family protein [Anaerolineaceae bacterium]|nr:YIP1 family protein [Anaerolineaceae bacterium]
MTELGLEHPESGQYNRRLRWDWILSIFYRPCRTLEQITRQERPAWLAPLLLLTILTVAHILLAAPARQAEAQMSAAQPPVMDYYTPEQQAQFEQGLAAGQGFVFIYFFPLLGGILGVWLSWLLLGSILHLALTLSGSRSTSALAFNLSAFAFLPTALRLIVRTAFTLVSGGMVQSPGLSGFITAGADGTLPFLHWVLSFVDLYLLWMTALLMMGVAKLPGLNHNRARAAALITILIWLALVALPGFLGAKLGQLSTGGNGPIFF